MTDGPAGTRPARVADTQAMVGVFHRARAAALAFLPVLHTAEEDRAFFGGHVAAGRATVAQDGGAVIGFAIRDGRSLEHLYVDPRAWRRGVGTALLRAAQRAHPEGLELWTFQRNARALAFYARHGFVVAERTDGAGNEEREPDARLVWAPPRR